MKNNQQQAAKLFAEFWKGKGYEKGESKPFWIALLRDVYGVEHPEQYISFEDKVHLDHTSFIDGYITTTRVMIEQKGVKKKLNRPIRQSDGTKLTPFQQAKRYIGGLPVSKHPRYVVTCNFAEFWVYDMEKPNNEPEKIRLKDLEKEYYRLLFLVESENEHIQKELEVSVKAGEVVGLLYDAFAKQYKNPNSEQTLKSLNVLCVRLVFCLYAEDAGIFGHRDMFYYYMKRFETNQMRKALVELFHILDTEPEQRDPYLKDDNPILAAFPYVNGGLFAGDIEIPPFTDEIRELLLEQASIGFDWSDISPTIFGAVFESTLNPETRRSGGMHYTSIENIHKVIDPLFLDDLTQEFSEICAIGVAKTKEKNLKKFKHKLASLTFLDPACGSGNFLTETYLSLRRLENDALRELSGGQMMFDDETINHIEVSIGQFYGIEINDFAVSVAKTALWIAESQMMKETEHIVLRDLDYLPLKSYTNIVEGNALRMDWEEVIPKEKLSYIMGNPPFVGNARLSDEQKKDRNLVFSMGNSGELDYVACWYKKAADYIEDKSIRCAFVSTNSICQGLQVAPLWQPLMASGITINYAYRTFVWESEASHKAHVYCIIVGFSRSPKGKRKLYMGDTYKEVKNINGYLADAPNVFISKCNRPLCNVPIVIKGFQPTDNGNLILDDKEREDLLSKEPQAAKWVKPFIAAKEFIYGKNRWCLWLVGISPAELNAMPLVMERVAKCKAWRESQTETGDAYKLRYMPTLMRPSSKFKESAFIVLPLNTGESRKYVPFGFAKSGAIPGNTVSVVIDATLYHFGVLTSNVHMDWMRAVCGRLKGDYRYSSDIVYNNFPWPSASEEQKERIAQTAQAILDARALYPDSSLADLYDEITMPAELRKAHQQNDRAVMQAYGFDVNATTESSYVAALMKMYQQLVGK